MLATMVAAVLIGCGWLLLGARDCWQDADGNNGAIGDEQCQTAKRIRGSEILECCERASSDEILDDAVVLVCLFWSMSSNIEVPRSVSPTTDVLSNENWDR